MDGCEAPEGTGTQRIGPVDVVELAGLTGPGEGLVQSDWRAIEVMSRSALEDATLPATMIPRTINPSLVIGFIKSSLSD
jgi:hypothetical protein